MEKPAKHRFLNNALFTALIVHGIGPGVSEEVFCRGFAG